MASRSLRLKRTDGWSDTQPNIDCLYGCYITTQTYPRTLVQPFHSSSTEVCRPTVQKNLLHPRHASEVWAIRPSLAQ